MFSCRQKPSSTMAYCSMEKEVICQILRLALMLGLPLVVYGISRFNDEK